MATADSDEMDFLIAADLTLYQNPLNSALNSYTAKQKTPTSPSKKEVSDTGTASTDLTSLPDPADTDEWIASDMTKYDSPLAELEKQHGKKMETSRLEGRTALGKSPATE